jgi:hypothetical protein
MFQQRRPHLETNIASRMWRMSCKPTHRCAQQSLASIALEPPRQPLRPSPEGEEVTGVQATAR